MSLGAVWDCLGSFGFVCGRSTSFGVVLLSFGVVLARLVSGRLGSFGVVCNRLVSFEIVWLSSLKIACGN